MLLNQLHVGVIMRMALILGITFGSILSANADDRKPPTGMPRLPYENWCAKTAFTWAQAFGRSERERTNLLEDCLTNEEKAIDKLFESWPRASAEIKAKCRKEDTYQLMAKCISG